MNPDELIREKKAVILPGAEFPDGIPVPSRFIGQSFTIGSVGAKTVLLTELSAHIESRFLLFA